MAKKLALTPASVDALQKGLLADILTPGLAIEVLASGKKRRPYRRQVAGTTIMVAMHAGCLPAQPIASAREWARGLNEKVEADILKGSRRMTSGVPRAATPSASKSISRPPKR